MIKWGTYERGLGDVSGQILPVGNNRLEYVVFDQPLALITEVIQADTISGIEIGNFGPNRLDISCATLRRVTAGGTEEYMIPNLTFLQPGQVFTYEFSTISSTEPAEYEFEFVGRLLDRVELNNGGLSGPQVIRNSAVQQSMLMDFDEVHPCNAGSYGDWNPNLDFYPANGVTATLQSYPANSIPALFK